MTKPHKHAALIKQWADDPSQHVWYWSPSGGIWRQTEPSWCETTTYALGPKPTQPPRKMCVLAGVEFPAPETKTPGEGQRYYAAMPFGAREYYWVNNVTERDWLRLGLVHLSREAAEQHARALLAANKQAIEGAK